MHIKLDAPDRRIFVPTPHGSLSWLRGIAKIAILVRLAIPVMMAMALGHIRLGRRRGIA